MRTLFTKTYLVFSLGALALVGCKSTQSSNGPKAYLRSAYIQQFKLVYLNYILRKSYNNSAAIMEVLKQDHSGFAEPLVTEDDLNFIDSIAEKHHNEIIVDSTKVRAEGSNGKRPLGFILEKLESNWLDSIARKRFNLSGLPKDWWKD